MSHNEQEIEAEIQAKGKTAPRLTPELIDSCIVREQYWQPAETVSIVCCLTLTNGFTVFGHSAPVSAENFDEAIGRKIAHGNARNEIWKLEGYLLKQRLFEQQ